MPEGDAREDRLRSGGKLAGEQIFHRGIAAQGLKGIDLCGRATETGAAQQVGCIVARPGGVSAA